MKKGKITQIGISTEYIKLEQFLKLADVVSTGGEAKQYLQSRTVLVNGETENRRGRKLYPGDRIELDEGIFGICSSEASD